MPDFSKDAPRGERVVPEGPRYCTVPGCVERDRRGEWVRSLAFRSFFNSRGELIELCGRHYLDGLDKAGKSVQAQLLRDPESIPSRLASQLRRGPTTDDV